jgi:hypothetical protein
MFQREDFAQRDVWTQKRALEEHIAASKGSIGSTVAKHAASAVSQRWAKQVNQPATHACALLSLIADCSGISERSIGEAKQFILQFGVHYLLFFDLASGRSDVSLRASLLHQLGCFFGRRDQYVSLEEHISTARSPGSRCTALDVWGMYGGDLPAVATALLSITASEAAVERSFSAQDAVHTKKRNRLLDGSVQNEMFVRFNRRALRRDVTIPALNTFSCVELAPEADFAATLEVGSDDETEPDDPVDATLAPALGAAAASSAAAAAAPAAPNRSQSMLDGEMRAVLDTYIADHHITLAAFAPRSRYWNGDRCNALQNALPAGGYVVQEAITAIKSILDEQHE